MVTPLTLQDGLNKYIEHNIAGLFRLKTACNNGEYEFRTPRVIAGFLIPADISPENDNDSMYPYIVTRISKVEHKKDAREAIVTIKIFFGAYCPGSYTGEGLQIDDASGYRDVWNMIETTRRALFEQRVIENKYRIAEDFFEAEVPDEQPYPFWQGFAVTKWHVVYPQDINMEGLKWSKTI